jgi:uncharacterized protein YndB with AHSA1/START domain
MGRAVAAVSTVLPAPPEMVYEEWLDPTALRDWMCPRPARCVDIEVQPWVGGRLRIDIEDGGVEFFVIGRFTVLKRPRELEFTWHCSTWPAGSGESIVKVWLDPRGDQATLMTIEHTLLPPGLLEQHRAGWAAIAGQLDAALRGTLPDPKP